MQRGAVSCWSSLALFLALACLASCQRQKEATAPAPVPPVAQPQPSEGMVVAVQSAKASADGATKVCVRLERNSGKVSGMQMDLGWDPSCLTMEQTGNGEPACTMNPEAQRSLFRAAKRERGIRVLFLNLNDTNPMPASVGELFCCQFRTAGPGRQCEVSISNAIASDPTGTRLPLTTQAGTVQVEGSAG